MGDLLKYDSLESNLLFGYDYNCDPCDRRGDVEEALGYCTNCREYLCRECYHVHCIPTPSEHHITILLSTEHRRSGSSDRDSCTDSYIDTGTDTCTDKCPEHGKTLKFYCSLHKKLCCRKCKKTEHTLCDDVQDISEASRKFDSNQVQEFTDKVSAIQRSTNEMFKTALQHTDKTEHNHEKIVKDIEHFKQEIKDWAEKLCEEMKELAERNRNENTDRLKEVSDKYSDASKQLQEINDNTQTLQNDSKNCSLFVYIKKAEETVESIQRHLGEINTENRTTLYRLKPNRELIQREAQLGSLQEKDKLGHYWDPDHLEAIYIRSGKDRYSRVSKRHSRNSVKSLATDAFNSLDIITESNEPEYLETLADFETLTEFETLVKAENV